MWKVHYFAMHFKLRFYYITNDMEILSHLDNYNDTVVNFYLETKILEITGHLFFALIFKVQL